MLVPTLRDEINAGLDKQQKMAERRKTLSDMRQAMEEQTLEEDRRLAEELARRRKQTVEDAEARRAEDVQASRAELDEIRRETEERRKQRADSLARRVVGSTPSLSNLATADSTSTTYGCSCSSSSGGITAPSYFHQITPEPRRHSIAVTPATATKTSPSHPVQRPRRAPPPPPTRQAPNVPASAPRRQGRSQSVLVGGSASPGSQIPVAFREKVEQIRRKSLANLSANMNVPLEQEHYTNDVDVADGYGNGSARESTISASDYGLVSSDSYGNNGGSDEGWVEVSLSGKETGQFDHEHGAEEQLQHFCTMAAARKQPDVMSSEKQPSRRRSLAKTLMLQRAQEAQQQEQRFRGKQTKAVPVPQSLQGSYSSRKSWR